MCGDVSWMSRSWDDMVADLKREAEKREKAHQAKVAKEAQKVTIKVKIAERVPHVL